MSNVQCRQRKRLWTLIILSFVIFLTGCGDIESGVTTLTISPSSVTVGVGQAQLFSAVGKDSLGTIVEVSPSWSADSTIGSISSSGLFTAAASAGQGTVVASYGGKTASATVTVTESGWLAGTVQSSLGLSAGIKVYLQQSPALLDFTDSSGKYSISDIPAGTYDALTESTDVFQAASSEVTIERGKTTTWNVLLQTQPGVPEVPTTTLPTF